MENIKDFIGCRCHSNLFINSELMELSDRGQTKNKTPAHTFPWAKQQYVEDRPVWPLYQSLDLVLNIEKKELAGTNTIRFKVLQKEVKSFKIDSVDLKIHSLQINGQPTQHTVNEKDIEVFLSEAMIRGSTGEIKISYTCHDPKAGIYFIAPDKQYP